MPIDIGSNSCLYNHRILSGHPERETGQILSLETDIKNALPVTMFVFLTELEVSM